MQHAVDAIRRPGVRSRFVVPVGRSPVRPHHAVFLTVSGPSPALAAADRRQLAVALRIAARRLGTIGALPAEQERSALVGASGMCWSPARIALRDHRRRSASPWRG